MMDSRFVFPLIPQTILLLASQFKHMEFFPCLLTFEFSGRHFGKKGSIWAKEYYIWINKNLKSSIYQSHDESPKAYSLSFKF